MQGGDIIDDPSTADLIWEAAADDAIDHALQLQNLRVHKSVVNRILEPFMWHTVIVTATEWQNFFDQRCSPLAQPEIRVAAEMMRAAYEASEPTWLKYHEWHTPYIQPDEDFNPEIAAHVSSARCARVSFLTHGGERDYQEDLNLFDRLMAANPKHWSPLEHVAKPSRAAEPVLGNFKGWHQYRHLYVGE